MGKAALLFAFLAVMCLSCTKDAYEKGTGDYSNMRADMVEMHADANKQIDYVDTDEGDRLTLTSTFGAKWITTADSVYRAYIYYNRVGQQADLISVGTVLVLRPHREDEPLTDPIDVESMWVSSNRRYLNAALLFKLGKADEGLHQTVGVIPDTLMVNADNTSTLHLTLYHDQGGVPQFYTQRAYASIPLVDIPADSVRLRVNTYGGWYDRTFSIKP